uniref:Vacuolar protein sorting-associated protein 51 homolog n=1 Tax=Blastobotrys adeninivorans TaxID=409370 RepID=A0A060TJ52_BLAAD
MSASAQTSSSARRKALREFYKLQSLKEQSEPRRDGSIDSEDVEGQVVARSELDDAADPDDFVKKIIQQSSVKELLTTENGLAREMRTLESEQKSLVYNNYNKLISAASTLESLQKTHDIQTQLDNLGTKLASISSINQTLPNIEPGDQTGAELSHAARWVLGVEGRMTLLRNQGKQQDAISEGNRALELIDKWVTDLPEDSKSQKELTVIKERISAIVSVLS